MRLLWTASQSHPISQGKTGWLPRLGILGFSFYHFTARWGRINTTLNSLLIQSFSSSSLILLLGWCRAQLRSGAAKHYNEIISLLVFSTNITSSSHFQWLQRREKQALIAFSSILQSFSSTVCMREGECFGKEEGEEGPNALKLNRYKNL